MKYTFHQTNRRIELLWDFYESGLHIKNWYANLNENDKQLIKDFYDQNANNKSSRKEI